MTHTDKPYHPLRDVGVNVYHCAEAEEARRYVAFFTGARLAIYFPAPTRQESHDRAVRWRDRTVEREEAGYLARRENLNKAREAKAKKKAKA